MHYTQVSKIERGFFGRLNENVQILCKLFKLDPYAVDGTSSEELHARLDTLIRDRPNLAVALRALFDALDGLSTDVLK